MATRERITVGSLVDEIEAARLQAVALDQPATAITASMSKAKLAGLLVDRKEHGQPGDFAKEQTPEGVFALVEQELGPAKAAALRAAFGLPEVVEQVPDEGTTGGKQGGLADAWPTDDTIN